MKEENLQIQVCQYLKWQYPDLIWCCDLSAGMRLKIGQAVKAKKMRSSRGLPDIFIFRSNGKYHCLLLELKTVTPFKKDGTLKSDPHLKEQNDIHIRLLKAGYFCKFVTGFDNAKNVIDRYMFSSEISKIKGKTTP